MQWLKIMYHIPEDTIDSVNISAIERACSVAHYIVGIIPFIHLPRQKDGRCN